MSLAKRIIPVILHKRGQMVKGRCFNSNRVVGNAMQAALVHASRSVDELVLIDITATTEGREPDYQLVSRLSKECFSPLTVGGGINKDEHIRGLLNAGADKVLIGAAAMNVDFMIAATQKYGSQCLSVAIDYDPLYAAKTALNDSGYSPERYAFIVQQMGAGEILLQSVERDGTMEGYDLNLIKRVSEAVNIPVIAAGGCGSYQHMVDAIHSGADAVAAGACWLFRDMTPRGAAEYFIQNGIEARLP